MYTESEATIRDHKMAPLHAYAEMFPLMSEKNYISKTEV